MKNLIDQLLEVYQINQRQAAKLLGVSESRISEWRSGEEIPLYMQYSIELHLGLPEYMRNRMKKIWK